MPSKNAIKTYVEDGYYHIYNRGVEKRTIFQDDQDYKVFLNLLKTALLPPADPADLKTIFTLQGESFKGIARQPKNFNGKIELIAYCLMPNHFHLLIHQIDKNNIEELMRSIVTRYVIYFNKKNKRVGSLFQGVYKGILIKNETYLLHLTRYIHNNPAEIGLDIRNTYSSYPDYLHLKSTEWLQPEIVLNFFENTNRLDFKKYNNYQNFVENYQDESKLILGDLILEE